MTNEVVIFAAGSLDKPELFVPRLRIYLAHSPQWTLCGDTLDNYDRMPVPSSPPPSETQ